MFHKISVVVLFALLAYAMCMPNREEWEATKQKCIEESGVNPQLVQWPALKEASSDKSVKCFRACIMKAHGLLNDDGTWNTDKVVSRIPADEADRDTIIASLTECASKKGADDCETVELVMACVHEKKIPFHRMMGGGRNRKED